jgi:hypothetical protein
MPPPPIPNRAETVIAYDVSQAGLPPIDFSVFKVSEQDGKVFVSVEGWAPIAWDRTTCLTILEHLEWRRELQVRLEQNRNLGVDQEESPHAPEETIGDDFLGGLIDEFRS